MNNRDKKNSLISEGKKKVLAAKELGGKADTRIFVSEHLTKKTGELLAATKEKLRDTGFVKFVWPSDGHVLIREDERSRVTRITDMKHLQELEEAIQEVSQRREQPSEKVKDEEGKGNRSQATKKEEPTGIPSGTITKI